MEKVDPEIDESYDEPLTEKEAELLEWFNHDPGAYEDERDFDDYEYEPLPEKTPEEEEEVGGYFHPIEGFVICIEKLGKPALDEI